MKKTFLSIMLLCGSYGMMAQHSDKTFLKDEFRIGIGVFPLLFDAEDTYYNNLYYNDEGCYFKRKDIYADTKFYYPVLNLSYAHRFKKWLTLELLASFTGIEETYNDFYTDKKLYSDRQILLSVMPVVRFHWLNKKYVSLYSSFGIGPMMSWHKNADGIEGNNVNETLVAMQFNFIGVAVGTKFYGYTELGASSSGVAKFGLGYRF